MITAVTLKPPPCRGTPRDFAAQIGADAGDRLRRFEQRLRRRPRLARRASDIAHSFGFTGYTLREVNVSANDQNFTPRPRLMAMEAKSAMADASVPVAAGKTSVVVTVSGAVQLK